MIFAELNLNKPLLNALTDMGLTTPTPIQERVFSVVMSGRDVCGIAQTGTGKTIAYLLPCLRQYAFSKERTPQLIVLVPTRELVVQVVETVRQLGTYLNLTAVGVYGGVNLKPQLAEVQQGADVLVATPGRLVDLLTSGAVKMKSLKRLVIDEVDEMLNLGFRAQLKVILDLLPPKRQNLLFSATTTPEVEKLMGQFFNDPVRIEAAPVGTPLTGIAQVAYNVPNFNTKINLLHLLLERDPAMSRVLVFVSTKAFADQLTDELGERIADPIGVIHSNKAQAKRFEAVNQFQDGTLRVLIATDVVSRGIDVTNVSHVINFDLPDEPESYIHRIGRTGRADKTGHAIAFITPAEHDRQTAIESLMQYPIPLLPNPADLLISPVLIEEEQPKVAMKTIQVKTPKREEPGPAFHEKKAKNQKVNVRRDYAAEKMLKYGRPIKRSGKK